MPNIFLSEPLEVGNGWYFEPCEHDRHKVVLRLRSSHQFFIEFKIYPDLISGGLIHTDTKGRPYWLRAQAERYNVPPEVEEIVFGWYRRISKLQIML